MKKLEDGIFPQDLKQMNTQELELLSYGIRDRLISTVSETGGHLASNLGIVELTIALHKVFDAPKDKIVWDVGHQSYVHKLLTGREPEFNTLRRTGGISGFPKRAESPYDTFDTGHASNSVSVALGMAAARDLRGDDYSVVAVLGDGALTGGMVYEAMNNAGAADTNLIVVLNDNEMSISKSEGSLAQHLGKLRSSEQYNNFKKKLKHGLKNVPVVGEGIYEGLGAIRDAVKYAVVAGVLFEELGFVYIGPIDGHDMDELIEVLTYAKQLKKPVLVHCVTKKGKGYLPAERNPAKFHGVSPFDKETGQIKKKKTKATYSEIFGKKLVELAKKDESIIAITAAMADGTGLGTFRENLPERFFDVGIAEEHAVSFAGGAAAAGLHPVVAIYSTFFQRAYDQIMTDVCMQNLPVTLCVDRAGVVGEDGETHHGVFDISYMSHMPNLTCFAPSDAAELERMLEYAVKSDMPCAIRYPRGEAPRDLTKTEIADRPDESAAQTEPEDSSVAAQTGFAGWPDESAAQAESAGSPLKARVLTDGRDVTIIAEGSMVQVCMQSAAILRTRGIFAQLIDARVLKPLDAETIIASAQETGVVLTAEDNVAAGGFGEQIQSLFACTDVRVHTIAWPDEFIAHGTVRELREKYGMDAESIAERVREALEGTS